MVKGECAEVVSWPRLTASTGKTHDMSQPSTTKRTQAAFAKRKKPVESSSQPVASKRPIMPLPPAASKRVMREITTQPNEDREPQTMTYATASLRPRAVVEKIYSDKQKAQLYPVVCDEMKQLKQRSSRLVEERRKSDEDRQRLAKELLEAKGMSRPLHLLALTVRLLQRCHSADRIERMEMEAKSRKDAQVYRPIARPCITKEEAVNIRLLATRELLGLQYNASDKIGKRWTYRGMLKDRSWKLLLVSSVSEHRGMHLDLTYSLGYFSGSRHVGNTNAAA